MGVVLNYIASMRRWFLAMLFKCKASLIEMLSSDRGNKHEKLSLTGIITERFAQAREEMSKSEMKRKNVMAGKPMMGEPREFWIFKGDSCFADELAYDIDTNSHIKHTSADGFYDLVSPNDTIEGGIHVIEHSAYDELQAKLDVARDYMASRRCRCGVTYVCRRCEALEKIKAVTTRVDDKQQNDNTGVEEIKQRLELAKPENCRQIVEDYEYLLQRIEMLEGALKHLKRHFVVKMDRKRLAVVNKALKESEG